MERIVLKRNIIIGIVAVAILVVAVAAYAYDLYGSGTLQIEITDPPTGWGVVTQVYVYYSSVEVHRSSAGNQSGWSTVVGTSAWISLIQILNLNKTLGSGGLQAGTYDIIRFDNPTAIVTIGIDHNRTATFENGQLEGLIIQGGGLQMNAGKTSQLLVELSVTVNFTINGTILDPTVRAVPI